MFTAAGTAQSLACMLEGNAMEVRRFCLEIAMQSKCPCSDLQDGYKGILAKGITFGRIFAGAKVRSVTRMAFQLFG